MPFKFMEGKIDPQNKKTNAVTQAVRINLNQPTSELAKERKSDTCILKYQRFVSSLFPVNAVFLLLQSSKF